MQEEINKLTKKANKCVASPYFRYLVLIVGLCVVYAQAHFAATSSSAQILDQYWKQSAQTYAITKALNATISTLMSVDVGINFFTSASINPLTILEPIDDMTERLSSLLMAGFISLSVQKIILAITNMSWFAHFLALFFVASWYAHYFASKLCKKLLLPIFLALFLTKACIPLSIYLCDGLYNRLIKPTYKVELDQLKQQSKTVNSLMEDSKKGLFKRLKEGTQASARFVKTATAKLGKTLLDAFISITLKLIILPLFWIWACKKTIIPICKQVREYQR